MTQLKKLTPIFTTILMLIGFQGPHAPDLTTAQKSIIKTQVNAASKAWITTFNRGDARGAADAYVSNAIMDARPMGHFEGRENIYKFWAPFIKSGARDLVYYEINIDVIDENTAHLFARWSMNVGRGFITLEEWVRSDDNVWRLTKDDFTVENQY